MRTSYAFIKAHRKQYSVQEMWRVLSVAQSGYYDWLKQPVSNRAQEDARLLKLIRASFVASHGIYGAPRVFLDLREAGGRAVGTASLVSCASISSVRYMAIARGGWRSATRPSCSRIC